MSFANTVIPGGVFVLVSVAMVNVALVIIDGFVVIIIDFVVKVYNSVSFVSTLISFVVFDIAIVDTVVGADGFAGFFVVGVAVLMS